VWIASAVVLGSAVPAIFAGILRQPRLVYLLAYVGFGAAFLIAYSRWSRIRWSGAVTHHWLWGLLAAMPVGFFAVRTVLWQQTSPSPGGLALALCLIWPGAVYGAIDGLFLSVFSVTAAWVVDYACRPGHYTIHMAQLAGARGRVYAMDIHPLAMETVARKAARQGLGNVTTVLGNSYDTGLPAALADRALFLD
jgi:SAM-dependent methyltransferase